MLYFDSSALVKLIAPEPESQALSEWVRSRWEQPRVTSALSQVDVVRRFREMNPAAEDLAAIVISKLDQLPLDQEVLDAATELRDELGPIEAIHVASAYRKRAELQTYVSYDTDLLRAAERSGLNTASPGAEVSV